MTVTETWVAALVTLGIYSFLYKDNPIFKFIQFVFAGGAVGYTFGYDWNVWVVPTFRSIGQGQWYLLPPVLVGLLIYFRYIPKLEWIARYTMSYLIGYGAGAALAFSPKILMGQISQSFIKLYGASTFPMALGNWVLFVAIVTGIVYFFFTIKQEGPVKPIATVGRYFIMAGMGTAFGAIVVYRFNLVIGRLQFLAFNWLHLSPPK